MDGKTEGLPSQAKSKLKTENKCKNKKMRGTVVLRVHISRESKERAERELYKQFSKISQYQRIQIPILKVSNEHLA